MSKSDDAVALPLFATVAKFEKLSGIPERTIYEDLSLERYPAYKRGRSTIVNVLKAIAYYEGLPLAKIRPQPRHCIKTEEENVAETN
jgi:hypothetical protein